MLVSSSVIKHNAIMLLIFPPVAKPCEPPAGIAKLATTMHAHNIPCTVFDANLEGMIWLLGQQPTEADTWSRRASRNLTANLDALKAPQTYSSFDRYSRTVKDVNRAIAISTDYKCVNIGLADYQDPHLSPLRSADLITAARHPSLNPYFDWFSKRLPELIANTESSSDTTVGFSLNYLSQALCTFAMIGFLRQSYPKAKIIIGGGLVSSWLKRPGWNNPFGNLVDQLVAGPGENHLLALHGVADRQHLTTPNYSFLPCNEYLSPGFILPYSAASGCYWNKCSFCPEPAEGNCYQPLPVSQVIADLHTLAKQTEPVLIHLLDNAISPALLKALIDNPIGVIWYGFTRFINELQDLDYCLALKRSGCVMLKIGLESGDQVVLDKLQKGIDLRLASQALRNLKRAGIAVYLYLLFGTPEETEVEARRTLDFVVQHHDSIGFLNLALFNMPIGSIDIDKYETEPFYEGDLSLYTAFRHPQRWGRKQVRAFLNREFKRHPAVSSILKNDPPFFSSNHAPFFTNLL